MAFKIAGSMAFKDAYAKADPVLLEPIMELEVTVPDEAVGAVNGDLNSRRGRLHGMEPLGGMTTIRAEVPMAEILTYSQSLTSLTGGRGDYHMQFLRYEEVPSHIAQKLIEDAKKDTRGVARTSRATQVAVSGAVDLRASAERTLLARRGRDALLAGRQSSYVDVCPLCADGPSSRLVIAKASPSLPVLPAARRDGALSLAELFGAPQAAETPPVARADPAPAVAEPSRRSSRLPTLFNDSAYRRTIAGIAQEPRRRRASSIVPLSGTDPRSCITVAWDISWYQYRVSPDRASRCGWPSAATSSAELDPDASTGTPTSTRRPARAESRTRVIRRHGVYAVRRPS